MLQVWRAASSLQSLKEEVEDELENGCKRVNYDDVDTYGEDFKGRVTRWVVKTRRPSEAANGKFCDAKGKKVIIPIKTVELWATSERKRQRLNDSEPKPPPKKRGRPAYEFDAEAAGLQMDSC